MERTNSFATIWFVYDVYNLYPLVYLVFVMILQESKETHILKEVNFLMQPNKLVSLL